MRSLFGSSVFEVHENAAPARPSQEPAATWQPPVPDRPLGSKEGSSSSSSSSSSSGSSSGNVLLQVRAKRLVSGLVPEASVDPVVIRRIPTPCRSRKVDLPMPSEPPEQCILGSSLPDVSPLRAGEVSRDAAAAPSALTAQAFVASGDLVGYWTPFGQQLCAPSTLLQLLSGSETDIGRYRSPSVPLTLDPLLHSSFATERLDTVRAIGQAAQLLPILCGGLGPRSLGSCCNVLQKGNANIALDFAWKPHATRRRRPLRQILPIIQLNRIKRWLAEKQPQLARKFGRPRQEDASIVPNQLDILNATRTMRRKHVVIIKALHILHTGWKTSAQ